MAAASRPPEVPLEAGIGPANPPCPVCGEPLFGWATSAAGAAVRRCEACGLAVVGEPGSAADVLAALERQRVTGSEQPTYRIANRASFQAWLSARAWAAIEPGVRYLLTPEAVRRLASDRDQTVTRVRWSAGAGITSMWATIVNSFTFGHNVALALFGRAVAEPARRPWQRGLDNFISAVTLPGAMPAALLLESAAALFRRGGVVELTLRLD